MRLEGKVAIVTGAARGLGLAYATALAREGARVLVADIDEAGVKAAAQQIEGAGGSALACRTDVTVEADARRMAQAAVDQWGRIDVLVNNAGIYYGLTPTPFYEIPLEQWNKVMEVNVTGSWLCARAVFPPMKAQGQGKIVNVSSGLAFSGRSSIAHYVTSKAAVIGLTRALAREMGAYGITVNAVAPGLTMTEASLRLVGSQAAAERTAQDKCLKRLQQPEDVVGTVLFLASDDSQFITGQTIVVDGGGTLH